MSDYSYLWGSLKTSKSSQLTRSLSDQVLPLLSDTDLLTATVQAVKEAGERLRASYDPYSRPADAEAIVSALAANDKASLDVLAPALRAIRPCPIWREDADDESGLDSGEWWVTDAAEGNINHIHGLPDWGVSATLVRDGNAVLTAISVPLRCQTYQAFAGGGAFVDGVRLHASGKADLRTALVGTGQASHDDGPALHSRLSLSVSGMLEHALVIRVSVPSTMQLLDIAAGRADAFWQFSKSRASLLCGALLVTEAGGRVTDVAGGAWTSMSSSVLATAPNLHGAVLAALETSTEEGGAA